MNPLTINGPVPFGRHRDGTYAAAEMRQRGVVVVGEPGSGKTVVEQNFVAGLVRCPDVLPWVIDLGGCGLALPWLAPWLDDPSRRPVLDWVAPTVGEALTMTEMALQVIAVRRRAYRSWMRQRNTDLLPCCHEVPAVYLILDEGKEAAGLGADRQLVANLIRVTDLGRAVGVRVLMTGLRAVADVIPTQMMTNTGIRVGMRVGSDSELNYLFGWRSKLNPRDTPYPGCGLWRDGTYGPVLPFRSFDLSRPQDLERVAVACEPWRPTLDEPSAAVPLGGEYAARWDRVMPWLTDGDQPEPARVSPSARVAGVDMASLDAKIARARREVTRPAVDVDAAWAELAARLGDDRAAGGEGWRPVSPRTRMAELLEAADAAGMSGPKLLEALAAEGLPVARSTLYEWLRADAVDGGYGTWVSR